MALADEKYMALTTFKRDGTAVTSPVWVVDMDDGKVGFYTSSTSGKIKRLTRDPKVRVQPCDSRGRITAGTTAIDGTAAVVTGPELEDVRRRVVAKYGFMTKVTKVLAGLGGIVKRKRQPYADRGVIVTPAAA